MCCIPQKRIKPEPEPCLTVSGREGCDRFDSEFGQSQICSNCLLCVMDLSKHCVPTRNELLFVEASAPILQHTQKMEKYPSTESPKTDRVEA